MKLATAVVACTPLAVTLLLSWWKPERLSGRRSEGPADPLC
jgi:hypothetical protein